MCGLGGFSRSAESTITDPARLAQTLAMLLDDRGEDATGFGWWSQEDRERVWFAKDGEEAIVFAPTVQMPDSMTTCIVHTRNGTKGSKKDNANNHPVVTDGIVLVHNGVVYNDSDIIKELGTEKLPGEVDTRALAHLLAFGPEVHGTDRPEELLERVDGWASIAWLNTDQPDVLHLAKLKQSPLYIAWTTGEDLIFASTQGHVEAAAHLMGIELVDGKYIKEGRYFTVKDGEIIFDADVKLFQRPPATTWTSDFPKNAVEGQVFISPKTRVEYIFSKGFWSSLSAHNAGLKSQGKPPVTPAPPAVTPIADVVVEAKLLDDDEYEEGPDDAEEVTNGKGRVVRAYGQALQALLDLGWVYVDEAPDQLSLPVDANPEIVELDHEYGGIWIDDIWHHWQCRCHECTQRWWEGITDDEFECMVADAETRQRTLKALVNDLEMTQ